MQNIFFAGGAIVLSVGIAVFFMAPAWAAGLADPSTVLALRETLGLPAMAAGAGAILYGFFNKRRAEAQAV